MHDEQADNTEHEGEAGQTKGQEHDAPKVNVSDVLVEALNLN